MSKNAVMPLTDYVAACDAIRGKTGSADLIKSGDMPDKINTVYEAGKQAQNDEFWNDFMEGVKANPYSNKYVFAGPGWTDKTFNPPNRSLTPLTAEGMFFQSLIRDYKGILERNGTTIDFSKAANASHLFYYTYITDFPVINLSSTTSGLTSTFAYLQGENITLPIILRSDGASKFNNTFSNSSGLTNLTIEGGVIGQNGFDVSACINLTVESLLSIINALMDYSSSGSTYTVTFGETNLNKLTDSQKAMATEKGWTLV